MTQEAKQKKAEYIKKWRAAHKENVSAWNRKYREKQKARKEGDKKE